MNNSRVGTVIRQKCGMNAVCTAYRSSKDADFRFENGTVKLHRKWDDFVKRKIQCVSRVDLEEGSNTRIGMSHMQKCGMNLTCIAYRGVRDCDFQFEDGHVVTHRTWQNFTAGSIARHTADEKAAQKIGQTKMQGCGMNATCITYRTYQDCDFRFEDGRRMQHRSWKEFQNGAIRYYRRSEDPEVRAGRSFRQKNGLDAVCVEYHSATDITVRFPDGKAVEHRSWINFVRGSIQHPLFTTYNGSSDFYGYTVAKAFTDESGNVYYRCTNNETGEKSIQTLEKLLPERNI